MAQNLHCENCTAENPSDFTFCWACRVPPHVAPAADAAAVASFSDAFSGVDHTVVGVVHEDELDEAHLSSSRGI